VAEADDEVEDDPGRDDRGVGPEHRPHGRDGNERTGRPKLGGLALYLTESDVDALLGPEDAVDAIEACFRRMAAGAVENKPRYRLRLDQGALRVMAAADLELGYAGVKTYAAFGYDDVRFVVVLFRASAPADLVAVIEANRLGQLRTGAASGVAARYLARPDARTLGVIGCGWQAESQVDCIRAAVPTIERVVAYCRTEERLRSFCQRVGAEAAETHREAGEQDVVVTVTTSRDPVLRGEWLRPGALVCAVGANDRGARELDNVVLERASFVCCDWKEQARIESGDLIEPVESGVLDWLEVHELHEVVAGELSGRHSPDDIAVFKSNGIAAWDVAIGAAAVERARDRGLGRSL
jgi:alanine dehydrogenase